MFRLRDKDIQTKSKSIEELLKLDTEKMRNKIFATNTVRVMVVGPSQCGKTTFLFNRLLAKDFDFTNIIVIAPGATRDHASYQAFAEQIDKIEDKIREDMGEDCYLGEDEHIIDFRDVTCEEDIPTVEELNEDRHYVIIVDDFIDVSSSIMSKINNLTTFGSKKNVSLFYLVQKLTVPKLKTTRLNCSSFILFKSCPKTAYEEISDLVSITKKDIEMIRNEMAKQSKHCYVIFNRDGTPNSDMILFGDDQLYVPSEFAEEETRAAGIGPLPATNRKPVPIRCLCFRSEEEWKILLTNHLAEEHIGNQNTRPYINGLVQCGEQNRFKPLAISKTFADCPTYLCLYVPDKNAWSELIMSHPPKTVMISLLNFGKDNRFISEDNYNRAMSSLC